MPWAYMISFFNYLLKRYSSYYFIHKCYWFISIFYFRKINAKFKELAKLKNEKKKTDRLIKCSDAD